jgi:hypothetical protein
MCTYNRQHSANTASCQCSFRVGAAGPRPSLRTALWRTASWRTAAWRTAAWRTAAWRTAAWSPPKHTGGRARTCGARAPCIGAPRLGPTASAIRCRIGPITYNCYWENAEKNLQREAGTREGAPCGPPGGGAGIKGRDRAPAGAVFSHRTRPLRAAARLRCTTSPLLATKTSSPAVPPIPKWGKRARWEAVIGRYPIVLVPNEPPTGRLLQGDDLPRQCGVFRPSREGDVFHLGPITAARPPRICRRHAPLPEL